jgi:hypothetical protein
MDQDKTRQDWADKKILDRRDKIRRGKRRDRIK